MRVGVGAFKDGGAMHVSRASKYPWQPSEQQLPLALSHRMKRKIQWKIILYVLTWEGGGKGHKNSNKASQLLKSTIACMNRQNKTCGPATYQAALQHIMWAAIKENTGCLNYIWPHYAYINVNTLIVVL